MSTFKLYGPKIGGSGAYFGQPKLRFIHHFECLPDRVEQNGQRDRDLRKICSQHTKFPLNRDGDVQREYAKLEHYDVFWPK